MISNSLSGVAAGASSGTDEGVASTTDVAAVDMGLIGDIHSADVGQWISGENEQAGTKELSVWVDLRKAIRRGSY